MIYIKRKIKDENVNDDDSQSQTKNNISYISHESKESSSSFNKVDVENMKDATIKIAEKISALKKRINLLETKYDFLNYCNIDLSQRNYKIKKDLSELNEKEQNLITLFFYIVRNFYPNVKFIDNCFVIGETTNSKTFLKKQEFINQLFNNLQFCYPYKKNIFEKQSPNIAFEDINIKECCSANFESCFFNFDSYQSKMSFNLNPSFQTNKVNVVDLEKEILYFTQINEFQKKYLHELSSNIPIEDNKQEYGLSLRSNSGSLGDISLNDSMNNILQKSDLFISKSPSFNFKEDFISMKRERDFELKEGEFKM